MLIALIAAGCMVFQDVLGVILVQAEAANRGWLAGAADTVGWYFAIATTSISVTALQSHSTLDKVYVLTFVGFANLLGTKTGQIIGERILRSKHLPEALTPIDPRVEARLAALEAR